MKLKLILTHVIVGILGLLLARTIRLPTEQSQSPQNSSSRHSAHSSESEAQATKTKNLRKAIRSPRSPEYLTAWQALPSQSLSLQDRITTQKRLLREWAKVDLTAAIEAALAEAWDSKHDRETGPLAEALSDAFAEDPEGSWLLIQSGQFGVGASLLRSAWYQSLVDKDPVLLSKKFTHIPFSDLQKVTELLKNNSHHFRENLPEIAKALLALPEHLIKTSDLIRFLPQRTSSEISTALNETKNFDSRETSLLLHQLAGHYRTYSLGEANSQKLNSLHQQLSELPKEVKGTLLSNILTNNGSNGYSSGENSGRGTLSILDLMVEGEHWDELSTKETWSRMKLQTDELPPEEVAAWAVNLPEQEELVELFHHGIDPYINQNIQESWEWIQDFPPGLWRDRALAEYSQQAWRDQEDYEASRRALDAIADPELRAIAEGWRPEHLQARDQEE